MLLSLFLFFLSLGLLMASRKTMTGKKKKGKIYKNPRDIIEKRKASLRHTKSVVRLLKGFTVRDRVRCTWLASRVHSNILYIGTSIYFLIRTYQKKRVRE